jgi:serine/threonine protein kinase
MNFCEKGTLSNLIEAKKKYNLKLEEKRIWKIISQFFIALAIMNEKNIAHRDVKDNNIFIDENDNIILGSIFFSFRLYYLLLLGDYGSSKEVSFDSARLQTEDMETLFIHLFILIFYFNFFKQEV